MAGASIFICTMTGEDAVGCVERSETDRRRFPGNQASDMQLLRIGFWERPAPVPVRLATLDTPYG